MFNQNLTIMKNPIKFRFLLLLTIALTQSCEKDFDDLVDSETFSDAFNSDFTDDNDDSDFDNNTHSDDSIDDSNDDFTDQGGQSDGGSITRYRVDGNNLIKEKDFDVTGKELKFQKDIEKHQEIWAMTKTIIPANYRSKMSHFMIFAGEADGTAGYVYETASDLSTWEMGIAIDFAYEGGFNAGGELAYTIIHEFGHILTLDNTQLDASISESDCQEYFPGEGCAKKEAYINKTYNKGWADIWSEFSEIQESQSDTEAFYNKYEDRFVTNYASTNPAEDIAEVFTTFVTRNGGVSDNSIAEQKIQIMYDHSELIDLRDHIRGNGASAKRSYLPVASSSKNTITFRNPRKGCLRH
jgi:hypothetical protein